MNQQLELPYMNPPQDIVEIKDLDHFVMLLSKWHTSKVNVIKHMLEVPESSEVCIGEDAPIQVTGDFRKGYQLGLSLALSELGELPFVAELEESAEATKH